MSNFDRILFPSKRLKLDGRELCQDWALFLVEILVSFSEHFVVGHMRSKCGHMKQHMYVQYYYILYVE